MNETQRRLFFAAPIYSQSHVSMGVSQNLLHNGITPEDNIHLAFNWAAISALAYNFNTLWAMALNTRPWDYFVLMHSDVVLQPGWLKVLIDQLEEHELDALSAVIAIKDDSRETSTAVLRKDGDLQRFNYDQLKKMPTVITQADMPEGDRLLINTGAMIVRFTKEWVEKWVWTFQDMIRCVEDGDKKVFVPSMVSEDWLFSLWAEEMGLKIGATQAFQVLHIGERLYSDTDTMAMYAGAAKRTSAPEEPDEVITPQQLQVVSGAAGLKQPV